MLILIKSGVLRSNGETGVGVLVVDAVGDDNLDFEHRLEAWIVETRYEVLRMIRRETSHEDIPEIFILLDSKGKRVYCNNVFGVYL